ncbi:MAG: hypothetical protein RBR77_15785, partial [Thauera sp.]|nr:hypothetical protein [Thauera sp.]
GALAAQNAIKSRCLNKPSQHAMVNRAPFSRHFFLAPPCPALQLLRSQTFGVLSFKADPA